MSDKETGLSAEMKRRTEQKLFCAFVSMTGCACGCVFEQIVHTFLGTKALPACSVWKCMLRQKKNTVLVFNQLKNKIVGTDVKLPKKKGGLSVQKWTSDYVLSARAYLVPLVMLS